MEAMQPTGSFKARGIGHACSIYKERGARRFVSSSGGNAGLAVAFAGRKLGVPVLVVVPETTSERAKHLIGMEDAEVVVRGKSWDEANRFALASCTSADAFLHPFDDPLIWEGHASMIDEVARAGSKPDAVVLSVGGGGLLCGVAEGLRRNGWDDVPLVAVETEGAASYAGSLEAGERIELPAITSIATSLGARSVCAEALAIAKRRPVRSVVVSDRQAVGGCLEMLNEHRIVVEPACGASVAALDSDAQPMRDARNILLIVCGGVGTNVDQLKRWSTELR
jgi:L-serine/L-threonine ammonia-lyase